MWALFKDKNEINEKNLVGFISFIVINEDCISRMVSDHFEVCARDNYHQDDEYFTKKERGNQIDEYSTLTSRAAQFILPLQPEEVII